MFSIIFSNMFLLSLVFSTLLFLIFYINDYIYQKDNINHKENIKKYLVTIGTILAGLYFYMPDHTYEVIKKTAAPF